MCRIELTGPPGSGKSTLLPCIKKILKENGKRVMDRADCMANLYRNDLNHFKNHFFIRYLPTFLAKKTAVRLFRHDRILPALALRFIAENIALTELVISSQKQRQLKKNEIERLIDWFFQKIGYDQLYKETWSESEYVLIDEGLLQYGLSLVASESEKPDSILLKKYLSLIPRPGLIISVTADTKTCLQRSRQNKIRFRFQDKSDPQISSFIENALIASRQLLDFFITMSDPVSIIQIDNSDDIAHAVDKIRLKLNQWSGGKNI
jgi:thymidylate kinase